MSCTNCLKVLTACALLMVIAGCGESETNAEASLDQRYTAAVNQKNPESRVGTLVALSADQYAAGDTAGATESLAAAIRAVPDVADSADQAKLLVRIATAQATQEGAKPAAKTLGKAELAARKTRDPAGRADSLAQISALYARKLKQVGPAIAAVEEAQKAAGAIEDPQSRVDAYCAIARSYATLKQTADVNRVLTFAATTAKSLDSPKRQSDTLAAVAAAHLELKDEKKAIAVLVAALERARTVDDGYSKSFALAVLAEQFAVANQTAQAEQLLGEAKKLAEGINDTGLKQEAAGRVKAAAEKMKL